MSDAPRNLALIRRCREQVIASERDPVKRAALELLISDDPARLASARSDTLLAALNAMTAMFREEVQQTHPSIQISLVSPGIVHTNFGLNALHGGPDSRLLPGAQTPEEVAAVIAGVIDSRAPDVYTRPGARERVATYYSTIGVDPS